MVDRGLRCCTKRTLLCVLSDSGERVCNNGDEQIDEPEIENDDTDDEEKTRHKKF